MEWTNKIISIPSSITSLVLVLQQDAAHHVKYQPILLYHMEMTKDECNNNLLIVIEHTGLCIQNSGTLGHQTKQPVCLSPEICSSSSLRTSIFRLEN